MLQAAAYNTGDVNVRRKNAAIFICAHSERFPKSIKAPLEGTGTANFSSETWVMDLSHKSQWLKDTIWWLMSRIASRFHSFLQHMIHLGDLTKSPLSWKHVLRCHWPPCYLFRCNLNESIVPHKQFRSLVVCVCGRITNWMKERSDRLKILTNFLLNLPPSDDSSAALPALSPGSTKREQIKIMRSMIWRETKRRD